MRLADDKSSNERSITTAVWGALLLLASFPVWAHHPMGGMMPETFGQGLLSGLGHPVIGADHFAFLVVALLLSWALPGKVRYVVPLAFVGATLAGTLVHAGAAQVPLVESLVALSVVLGAVFAVTRHYPGALLLTVLFAMSGFFHGYAYGEAVVGAETTPILAYLLGLSAIQYAVVLGGILGLDLLARRSQRAHAITLRLGGAAALVTGAIFFIMSIA